MEVRGCDRHQEQKQTHRGMTWAQMQGAANNVGQRLRQFRRKLVPGIVPIAVETSFSQDTRLVDEKNIIFIPNFWQNTIQFRPFLKPISITSRCAICNISNTKMAQLGSLCMRLLTFFNTNSDEFWYRVYTTFKHKFAQLCVPRDQFSMPFVRFSTGLVALSVYLWNPFRQILYMASTILHADCRRFSACLELIVYNFEHPFRQIAHAISMISASLLLLFS